MEAQYRHPDSLLNWTIKLFRTRTRCVELGRGDFHLLDTGNPAVFAHYARLKDTLVVAVHNLGEKEEEVQLDLGEDKIHRFIDVFGDAIYEEGEKEGSVKIHPLGYRWFRGEVVDRKF